MVSNAQSRAPQLCGISNRRIQSAGGDLPYISNLVRIQVVRTNNEIAAFGGRQKRCPVASDPIPPHTPVPHWIKPLDSVTFASAWAGLKTTSDPSNEQLELRVRGKIPVNSPFCFYLGMAFLASLLLMAFSFNLLVLLE